VKNVVPFYVTILLHTFWHLRIKVFFKLLLVFGGSDKVMPQYKFP